MTNQEIEKRFLFDLEMGLFKETNELLYKNKTCFIDNDSYLGGLLKLSYLLKKLNFKLSYSDCLISDICSVFPHYIEVNLKTREFREFKSKPSISFARGKNKVPEYLKDYNVSNL